MGGGRDITIVYDGECPFCSAYVRMLRMKDSFDSVRLVSARDADAPLAEIFGGKTFDLDEGMVVKIDGALYHGAAAMTALSLVSTRADWFNRLAGGIFAHKRLAAVLYPFCRLARFIALKIKGVPMIRDRKA